MTLNFIGKRGMIQGGELWIGFSCYCIWPRSLEIQAIVAGMRCMNGLFYDMVNGIEYRRDRLGKRKLLYEVPNLSGVKLWSGSYSVQIAVVIVKFLLKSMPKRLTYPLHQD